MLLLLAYLTHIDIVVLARLILILPRTFLSKEIRGYTPQMGGQIWPRSGIALMTLITGRNSST
jgi:hypothetical protein